MSMVRTSLVLARRWFPGAAKRFQNALGVEVIAGPVNYHEDGMTTVHNSDFLVDPHFVNAYAAAKATEATGGYDLRWRTYVVCWAAQQGLALDGDFVECGTNRGHLASAVIEYTNFAEADRKFYLLDTYNGLVEKLFTEEERRLGKQGGGYTECYEEVKERFARYPNVVIVRGTVPDTLTEVTSEKVAFLSIDMNNVTPEIAAGEYFWDRLSPGAVIVLDDYGWRAYRPQKEGWDRFARKRGIGVLTMPTGQGLIIKP